jgi:hypothetical protein
MHKALALAAVFAITSAGVATASIISATGIGTASLVGFTTAGPVAFGPDPGYFNLAIVSVSGPSGGMSFAYSASTPDVYLIRYPLFGPAPSGYPYAFAPVGSSGYVEMTGSATATYTLDAGGLGPTILPALSTMVFWVGSSGTSEFHESISFSSAHAGALGTLTLDFTPPIGSTGLIPILGPSGLTLPALTAGDVITVTGSFDLKSNALHGAATEIKVAAPDVSPEPGTWILFSAGLLALAIFSRTGAFRL